MKTKNAIWFGLGLVTLLLVAAKITTTTLQIGEGAAEDITIEFDKGLGTNNPKLKWDNATSKIQFSNDGTSFVDLGSGGGTATGSAEGTVTSFAPIVADRDNFVTSADYTVLDADGYDRIFMSTGAVTRTVTLPTLADNQGRMLEIIKTDTGVGDVTLDGEGAETIEGSATFTFEVGTVKVLATASDWKIVGNLTPHGFVKWTVSAAGTGGFGSTATQRRYFTTGPATNSTTSLTSATSATAGTTVTVNEPGIYAVGGVLNCSSGTSQTAIGLNHDGTTVPTSSAAPNILDFSYCNSAIAWANVSWVGELVPGDVLTLITNNPANITAADGVTNGHFTVQQVARYPRTIP